MGFSHHVHSTLAVGSRKKRKKTESTARHESAEFDRERPRRRGCWRGRSRCPRRPAAVGESSVICAAPPSTFSRCFNSGQQGGVSKMAVLSPTARCLADSFVVLRPADPVRVPRPYGPIQPGWVSAMLLRMVTPPGPEQCVGKHPW